MPEIISQQQIGYFKESGYVRIDGAFSSELAKSCREILWRDSGCNPDDPTTWSKPVIRLGYYSSAPFQKAVNSPQLISAFNGLVGIGKWLPRSDLGSFVIRFPSTEQPADTGWHIDAGFPGDDPNDYLNYRVNLNSKGRCLLMLFLFSEISERDAPTLIRVGSHKKVAELLEPYGEAGLGFMELAALAEKATAGLPEIAATGSPGTVYLCHPFIVHAGQAHIGTNPRFLAQPPLHPVEKTNSRSTFNVKR